MNKHKETLEWKPALTIRPNAIGGLGGVQVSDAISQQRYKVSQSDLLDLLCVTSDESNGLGEKQLSAFQRLGLICEPDKSSDAYDEGIKHWEKHNWQLALGYYCWALREEFLDEGEDYEEIRCGALRKMLAESPVPLPIPISSNEIVNFGDATPIPCAKTLGNVLKTRVTTQFMNPEDEMSNGVFHGLLLHGFSVSRKYHVPDIDEHIHNLLHGVGFAFDPFIAVFDVQGLQSGIYYYSISQDALKLIKQGDFRQEVCRGLIGHQQALTAACTVFLVADFPRFQWRYRHERALRNLYVDVGRMAQYFILVATAYGIKNHITPATVDDLLAGLLNINSDDRQVFYSITLGY